MDRAIFAGGCFWCTEAYFIEIDGVESLNPGYIGGNIDNPTYEMICKGNTGHVEAIEIIYDSEKISYLNLLEVFFDTHDPTQVDGQGNDLGTQYMSAIYYTNDKPHIGHAYTTIACDVLSRFNKLKKTDVFFLTGTDEHGQKVEKAAKDLNRDPKEFVDDLSINFKNWCF